MFVEQPVPKGFCDPSPVHWPPPVQVAKPLHIWAGTLSLSSTPAGRGKHVPLWPGSAHELQLAQAASTQQTDSTQFPLAHSAPTVHAVPSGALVVVSVVVVVVVPLVLVLLVLLVLVLLVVLVLVLPVVLVLVLLVLLLVAPPAPPFPQVTSTLQSEDSE
jgi:hypothetical protein